MESIHSAIDVLASNLALIRYHSLPAGHTADGDRRYATFFTNVVVKSGLQQAHAIPLAVNPVYAKAEPRSYFTAAITPLSTEGDGRYGLCPVYAARVVFDDKQWRVTDRTFRPAEAMFLSVISTSRRSGDTDGFIPLTRLVGALVRDRT